MGLFDRIFGRDREAHDLNREAHDLNREAHDLNREVYDLNREWREKDKTFDIIGRADAAAKDGRVDEAERLFGQGVRQARKSKTKEVDFALGRLGAFLRNQGRTEEALAALSEAVALGTDIPRIWDDYLRCMAESSDVDGFVETLGLMRDAVYYDVDSVAVNLSHISRARRNGDYAFAEQLCRHSLEIARSEDDRSAGWAFEGELGHILEKTERLSEAIGIWRGAFNAGSDDPTTNDRLSMKLHQAEMYQDAAEVIREALTRRLPANVDERLRKRLLKCEEKLGAGGTIA